MAGEMAELYGRDGSASDRDGAFGVDAASVLATVVIDLDDEPVGHASLRQLNGDVEIKRMYVSPRSRGQGVAARMLVEMEEIAHNEGARRVILHTGDRQMAAIAFYQRHGYRPIPVYPPYVGLDESLCFEKVLSIVESRP